MARLNVNPTRMELRRLKDRLKTAKKGHKLLKDKSDEMVRQFMDFIRENRALREAVEAELIKALHSFVLARAENNPQELEQALMMPSAPFKISAGIKNVMGVDVPLLDVVKEGSGIIPYSFISLTASLDGAVQGISEISEKLIMLAEVEKTCNMLADEIEKNRRRVNALEHFVIPQLEETIKYIMMKLDENERGNLTRLMKVKSMIAGDDN